MPFAFGFTDIESSSAFWEAAPEAMATALACHDALLRRLLAEHGGDEVKTEGDAFMVRFGDATDALAWACSVQLELLAQPWPEAILALSSHPADLDDGPTRWRGLRVRMGFHWGDAFAMAHPKTGAMDYYGPNINRASRTCNAANGGQILVTEAMWHAIGAEARGRLDLVEVDLGQVRFRGLAEPDHLRQLLPRALAGRRFGAIRAERARQTNLSQDPTTFVGREHDLAALDQMRARGARLITLLGPGGVGKTRLSREWGVRQVGPMAERGGGVWFCDLAECRSSGALARAVALTLGLTLPAREADSVAQIGDALRGMGAILLILDNLEQVVQAAREALQVWMAMSSEAMFLVTTRAQLELAGEHLLAVDPLPSADGVSLFLARAVQQGARLPRGAGDEDLVRLVRALDGLPLAIELAAARARSLSPAAILARLLRQGDLPGRGDPSHPTRHATLRAAMAWSWELLSPAQRTGLARCAVFRGSFDLEAAEVVLGDAEERGDAWELLADLNQQSMVRTLVNATPDGELRYQILEYIRAFALAEIPPDEDLLARHAAWYLAFGERLCQRLGRGGDPGSFSRLSQERENLEAVSETFADRAEGVRAALVLDAILERVGPLDERLRRLDSALPVAQRSPGTIALARLCFARGQALRSVGRLADAEQSYTAAIEVGAQIWGSDPGDATSAAALSAFWRGLATVHLDQRRLGAAKQGYDRALALAGDDRGARGQILVNVGVLERRAGRPDEAARAYRDAQADAETAQDPSTLGLAWNNLGVLIRETGRLDEASRCYWQALEAFRAGGDLRRQGLALNNLGILSSELRSLDQAELLFQEALGVLRRVGDIGGEAIVLNNRAFLLLEQRRIAEASQCAHAARAIHERLGDRHGLAVSQSCVGVACCHSGELVEALRWLRAAAEGMREVGDAAGLSYHRALLGAALADLGRLDEADQAFAQAEAQPGPRPEDLEPILRVCRAHLELARAGPGEADEILRRISGLARTRTQEVRVSLALLASAARRATLSG